MQRLSGLDAGFLYMETPTLLMHTLKLALLEPAEHTVPVGDGDPTSVDEQAIATVRARIVERLHLLPPLRRRLVEVPFGFHHPVWIEDPDFAIEHHVHRVPLAAPGTLVELHEAIGALASTSLDRSRPLWELYVLDGLADGRIAVLVKIHHAVADGVAAANLLANVMATNASTDAEAEGVDAGGTAAQAEVSSWVPEPAPSAVHLLGDAAADHLRLVRALPALVLRTGRNLARVARRRRETEVQVPRPILDAPRTSFNRGLTTERVFVTTSVSLPEVKRVSREVGVTMNDVVLAVVGGALRAHLSALGELPDRSLVASVPIATGVPEDGRLAGNKVANLFTTLATHEPEPVARARRIHEVTVEAKIEQELLGIDMFQEWVEYTPPALFAWIVRQYSRFDVAEHHPPPVNVVVSNVPGPRLPLYADGARLDELYSVGPILEGVGLNITVWSYCDRVFVGVLGCQLRLEEAQALADALPVALRELADAAAAVRCTYGEGAMVGGPRTVH
jgi:diacylglycerol O-acyltransferase